MCRPYTFPVCPATEPKWNMDREFAFQSSAIQFLSDKCATRGRGRGERC